MFNLFGQVRTFCVGRLIPMKINLRLDFRLLFISAVTGNGRDGGHQDDEAKTWSDHLSTENRRKPTLEVFSEASRVRIPVQAIFFLGFRLSAQDFTGSSPFVFHFNVKVHSLRIKLTRYGCVYQPVSQKSFGIEPSSRETKLERQSEGFELGTNNFPYLVPSN